MKALIGSACILLALVPGNAALPLYEPFNYTAPADLDGKSPNGVDLWWAMGTLTPGLDKIQLSSGSLTVPGLAGPLGNSIGYAGNGRSNQLSIGTPITSGTVYYSFAMSVTSLSTLDAIGGHLAGFNNVNPTTNAALQPTIVGTRLLTRTSGDGYQIGVSKNSATAADYVFDPTVHFIGETVFIVGSYTFSSGTGSDDLSQLWINPGSESFGLGAPAPTLSAAIIGTDLAQVGSFIFRQGSTTGVPGVTADELRVDTTWAGVTPVPEPASVALLALGGGSLLARRRSWRR